MKKGLWVFWGAALHAACKIIIPNQGSNPCPLQWKHGVLTTGWPGKSLEKGFEGVPQRKRKTGRGVRFGDLRI